MFLPSRIPVTWWLVVILALVANTFRDRAALAKVKGDLATATQKAEREQRDKEQALQTQADRVAHDEQTRQTTRLAHAVGVDRAVDSLRSTIANAGSTSQGASLATLTQDAATARDLLGRCASEYSSVAKVADQLSDQVTGLQDFVATATTTTP